MAKVNSRRRIERAGVNALRSLLEDHHHLVQEIDGGADHGEDLYVAVVREGRRTGHLVAVQVKSGQKYTRAQGYAIPVEDHREDWKQSRIPVIGVVYDLDKKQLFWTNLTQELRDGNDANWIHIPRTNELSPKTMGVAPLKGGRARARSGPWRGPWRWSWQTRRMTEIQWADLSHTERELMVCALEGTSGLAFVDDRDEDGELADLPAEVLRLVDRGWVTVHRMEPWTAPDGRQGTVYGAAVARGELPGILADPATWEGRYSYLWWGAVTLWLTEAGWVVSTNENRGQPPELPAGWVEPAWVISDFQRDLDA